MSAPACSGLRPASPGSPAPGRARSTAVSSDSSRLACGLLAGRITGNVYQDRRLAGPATRSALCAETGKRLHSRCV